MEETRKGVTMIPSYFQAQIPEVGVPLKEMNDDQKMYFARQRKTIVGDELERRAFYCIKDVLEHCPYHSVIFSGLHLGFFDPDPSLSKKEKKRAEFDLLGVVKELKVIFYLECKNTFSLKKAVKSTPFKRCFQFLEDFVQVNESWHFVGAYLVGQKPEVCSDCPFYVIDGSSDDEVLRGSFKDWLTRLSHLNSQESKELINANLTNAISSGVGEISFNSCEKKITTSHEKPIKDTDDDNTIFIGVVQVILFCAAIKENRHRPRDAFSYVLEAMDKLSKGDLILLYSPQQKAIMSKDPKRLLLSSSFGTGKSFLLQEKCTEVLKNGDKALFILSFGGWSDTDKDPKKVPSFLLNKLRETFAKFTSGKPQLNKDKLVE